ncbi:MAG: hypothetical protein ACHREM_29745 [Polyangiales bacterium]
MIGERGVEGAEAIDVDARVERGERIEARVRRQPTEPRRPTLRARPIALEHGDDAHRHERGDDRALGGIFRAALEDREHVAEVGRSRRAIEAMLGGDLVDA